MTLEDCLNPPKVLFFLGHTPTAQGARTYEHEHEFSYNKKVMAHANRYLCDFRDNIKDGHAHFGEIEVHCSRQRIHFFHHNLRQFAQTFTGRLHNALLIELHFNSFSRAAEGREILVRKTKGGLFGRVFKKRYLDDLYERLDTNIYPSKRRGWAGIRWVGPHDRGFGNLLSVDEFLGEDSIATIFEPEFLSHKTKASVHYVENPKRYGQQLARWALAFTGICRPAI